MEQPRVSEPDVPLHDDSPALAPLCESLLLEKCDEMSELLPANRHTSKPRSESDIPEGGVQSYPSLIDPSSAFLPPIMDTANPSSEANRTFFLAALPVREETPQVKVASVFLPFKKHRRSKSLPETTLPMPMEAFEGLRKSVLPGPTPSPNNGIGSRPSRDAEISIPQPTAASEEYPWWAESFLAYMERRKRRRSLGNSQDEVIQSMQLADSDSHSAPSNPPSEHQVSKRRRRGATWPKNLPLPPQEWHLDTYMPTISAASIPLPSSKQRRSAATTTTATPPTLPSASLLPAVPAAAAASAASVAPATPRLAAAEPVRIPTIIITLSEPTITYHQLRDTPDMSRLHPNAAWSQLASWAHKKSVKLDNENTELRAENSTLRDMLGRLSRVLCSLSDDEQAVIHTRLEALPEVEETR